MNDYNIEILIKAINEVTPVLQKITKDLNGLWKEAENQRKTISKFFEDNKEGFQTMSLVWAGALAVLWLSIKQSIDKANEYNNALTWLKSVVVGLWLNFDKTKEFIGSFTEDGLVSVADTATALKNLLARGFWLKEATEIMLRFKDSAAFGRQSSLSLWEAIKWATEWLKNENSVLVDNAWVTKNVSVMRKEYAEKIWVWVDKLTLAQKREAEYQWILEETKFQMWDAAKLTDSLSWKKAKLDTQVSLLNVTIWNALTPTLLKLTETIIPVIAQISSWVEKNPDLTSNLILGATWVAGMTTAIGALWLAMPAVIKWFQAFNLATKFLFTTPTWLIITWIALAVVALATARSTNFLGIQDLTKKVFGYINNFLQWTRNTIQSWISEFLSWFSTNWWDDLNQIRNLLKEIWWQLAILFKQYFDWFKQIITLFFTWAKPFWQWSWELLSEVLKNTWAVITYTIKATFSVIMELVKFWLDTIKNLVKTWNAILNADFGTAWNSIKNIFSWALTAIVNISKSLFGPLIDWMANKLYNMVPNISQILSNLKSTFTNIWNSISNTVSGVVNSIIWFIDNLISKIESAINTIKNFGSKVASTVNSFSFPWAQSTADYILKQVWYRAEWWSVSSGSPYIVWEQGPELFIPNSSWTIVPNHELWWSKNITVNINLGTVNVSKEADENRLVQKIYNQIKYWNLWII